MQRNFLILSFFLLAPGPALAQQPSILNQILTTQAALVEVKADTIGIYKTAKPQAAINPQTGRVMVRQNLAQANYERKGAGVIIHPQGVIVTNAHIVSQANQIKITLQDQTTVSAKVVRLINDLDVALLKIDISHELPFVELADSNQIQLGEEIITSGNSPLLNQTVTGGKIIGIGVNRSLKLAGTQRTDLIQTTVNLYQGDSGGPLFDKKGRLIGLMTAKETSADHSSFAIPSNKIAAVLNDYLKTTQPKNP